MTLSQAQSFTTTQGDSLRALVQRVYRIQAEDQAIKIALIVAQATPGNRSVLRVRLQAPLSAGLLIDFPAWADIARELEAAEKNRERALQASSAPKVQARATLAAPKPLHHAAGLSAYVSAPQTRNAVQALMQVSQLTPSQAAATLQPLSAKEMDGSSTLPASVMRIHALGEKMSRAIDLGTLRELLARSDTHFFQQLRLFLTTAAPRNFPPGADTSAAAEVLAGGFSSGLEARVREQCEQELARRAEDLQTVLAAAGEPPALQAPLSAAFPEAGSPAEVIAALREAMPPTPAIAATILDAVESAMALPGKNGATARFAFLREGIADETGAIHRFLDTWGAESRDGTVARWLYVSGRQEQAQSSDERHRDAIARARAHVAAVMTDDVLAARATGTPSEVLAVILPDLLRGWRGARPQQVEAVQEEDLADERRLLAGRNFISFRKDVAATIDQRLAQAQALAAPARLIVLLALLTHIGHRLAGMPREQVLEVVDALAHAAR